MRYFCHTHHPRFAQFKTLVDSIGRFETALTITVVCPESDAPELLNWTIVFPSSRGSIDVVTMEEVARDCGEDLPWSKVAAYRTPRDTSWTMQACLPWWIMRNRPEDQFFYVDGDCFFFQSLRPHLDEIPEQAFVGICPHYFPAGRENIGAGKFNNGEMFWRKTDESIEHARKWGLWAIEVFAPHEQKVLEDWPAALGDKCWIFSEALNWGPWRRDKVSGSPPRLANGQLLQSLHAHEFRLGSGPNETVINSEFWSRSGYDLDPATVESLYLPYEEALRKYA